MFSIIAQRYEKKRFVVHPVPVYYSLCFVKNLYFSCLSWDFRVSDEGFFCIKSGYFFVIW